MTAAPITVLTLRGCSEPLTNHMLLNIVRKLDRAKFRHVEIVHPATMGPVGGPLNSPSERETVRIGCELLDREYAAAPGGVVVLWYSLGGVIGTHWLNTRDPGGKGAALPKLRLAGGLANPCRAFGRAYGREAPGEGIYSGAQRHLKAWAEIANPGDVITAMPLDSPLRTGSNLIQAMSLVDPIAWALDVVAKLPAARLQILGREPYRALDPRWWGKWSDAIRLMNDYARGGAHTEAYFRRDWRDYKGMPISGVDLLTRCIKQLNP